MDVSDDVTFAAHLCAWQDDWDPFGDAPGQIVMSWWRMQECVWMATKPKDSKKCGFEKLFENHSPEVSF